MFFKFKIRHRERRGRGLRKNKKDFLCCREREKDFSTFDEADCVSAGDIFLQKVYSAVPLKIFQKNIKISFFHFENGNKLLCSLSPFTCFLVDCCTLELLMISHEES